MSHQIESLAKTIIFLKNYQRFSCSVRETTASVYLDVLKHSPDENTRKAMILRIMEEFMASSEDLTMWLSAVYERNNLPAKYRDIEEYLLDCRAGDQSVKDTLCKLSKIRTTGGLIRKLNFPPLTVLSSELKMPAATIEMTLEKILESIKATHSNRTTSRGALIRYHNKVKHGMMVSEENGLLIIKDIKFKDLHNGRHYRKYRTFTVEENLSKAKSTFNSIHALSQMIHLLASILLVDLSIKIQNRKRKLGKRQQEILERTLHYSNK